MQYIKKNATNSLNNLLFIGEAKTQKLIAEFKIIVSHNFNVFSIIYKLPQFHGKILVGKRFFLQSGYSQTKENKLTLFPNGNFFNVIFKQLKSAYM